MITQTVCVVESALKRNIRNIKYYRYPFVLPQFEPGGSLPLEAVPDAQE